MKNILKKIRYLSVFDIIIILMVVFATGYALMYFTTKTKYVFIEVVPYATENSTEQQPLIYHEADSVKNGDAVYNSFGQKTAEVTDVTTVNFGGVNRFFKAVIKVKAKYNPRTKIYSYNDSPLLIGNYISLTLGQVAFKGKIMNIYASEDEKYANYEFKNVVATILFRGIEPSHAEAMKTFTVYDSKNNLLAKTLESDVRAQQYDVTDDKGNVLQRQSTIYKDVTLKIYLPNVPCAMDTCFFNDNIDLKVGIKYFWAHSDITFLSNGIITDLMFLKKGETPEFNQ